MKRGATTPAALLPLTKIHVAITEARPSFSRGQKYGRSVRNTCRVNRARHSAQESFLL